jgi:hypothetical protein
MRRLTLAHLSYQEDNAQTMRKFLVLAILATLGVQAGAEVIRCTDAAGNVSYTDGACPKGAKLVARVTVTDALATPGRDRQQDQGVEAGRASPPQGESREVAAAPPQVPAGPIIIDGSRTGNGSTGRSEDSRWNFRGDDPPVLDDGYFYPGVSRRPNRPRDMRPRITSCDDRTCKDTQGNHFDRSSGQLDRYRSIDGRTCRPVVTTTICR